MTISPRPHSAVKRIAASLAIAGLGLSTAMCSSPSNNSSSSSSSAQTSAQASGSSSSSPAASFVEAAKADTSTPIKHLVVIFPENVSFDHYFATYPKAANTPGETQQGSGAAAPTFTAKAGTPEVNNLANSTGTDKGKDLLTQNPNSVQPFRFTPEQSITTDQGHSYDKEQKAYNGGKMDKFPESVSVDSDKVEQGEYARDKGTTMGYYDGNTVTGMWNYAQNYSMSDNSWTTQFGPSTPGAINLVAGATTGAKLYAPAVNEDKATGQKTYTPEQADPTKAKSKDFTVGDHGFSVEKNGQKEATVNGDPDPAFDDCTDSYDHAGYDSSHKNVGDSMNEKGITWGWFEGGFKPTTPYDAASKTPAQCESKSSNVAGQSSADYIAHHEPFQYFASTANPHHLPPSSTDMIGKTDQANHQYDLTDFSDSLKAGNLPSVSFLKAPAAQDGHPGYSGPLDEQKFIVNQINAIQNSKFWDSTAIMIAYDDSDGWYDHQAPKVTNGSDNTKTVDGKQTYGPDAEICTSVENKASGPGFCGPGTRVPLLAISPYSKVNFVDHSETEQASILKFIQDNWHMDKLGGDSADKRAGSIENMFDFSKANAGKLELDPTTGATK